MAKMFYTLEETKATLGRNEEGIKQLSREGRLREFRDGPRLMFKADQVDTLKAELASSGEEISLAPAEPEADVSTSDTKVGESAQGTRAGQTEDAGATGSGLLNLDGSVAGAGSGMLDLAGTGAGGSVSGGSGASASAHGTRAGVTIFDVDESQRVDPSAQTAINAGGGPGSQLALEGTGSGSGLLDLTRESDDTSLGAVFDELNPAKTGAVKVPTSAMPAKSGPAAGAAVIDSRSRTAAPTYIEAPDPVGVGLGLACIVPTFCACFACFVIGAALIGYRPGILDALRYGGSQGGQLLYYAVGAVIATAGVWAAGYFLAKAARQ
jgi:hypothetical protein